MVALSFRRTDLVRDSSDESDLTACFQGAGQRDAPLNAVSLEHGNESDGHGGAGARPVAPGRLIRDPLHRDGSTMGDGRGAFYGVLEGVGHGADV